MSIGKVADDELVVVEDWAVDDAVEVEAEVDAIEEIVDRLDETDVVLVARAIEELLVLMVDTHAQVGEGASTKYAPAAAAKIMTTIATVADLPNALRCPENLGLENSVVNFREKGCNEPIDPSSKSVPHHKRL